MEKKQKQFASINAWKKENTDRIQILPRKEEHIPERVQQAILAGLAKSRQEYILDAIRQKLASDGF